MDYKNAKIYKILNDIDDDVYVGSTCQPLSQRIEKHRSSIKPTSRLYRKMIELGKEHFYIELIEETPCENIEQLKALEGRYIREISTLNQNVAGRTDKQYREDNRDIILENSRKYRENNKEEIAKRREGKKEWKAEYDKQYREKNKDKILEYKKQYYIDKQDNIVEYHKNYYQEKLRDKCIEKSHVNAVVMFQGHHYETILKQNGMKSI